MKIFADDSHRQHHALELDGAVIIPSWECPERVYSVMNALQKRTHEFATPDALNEPALTRVHTPAYLSFLATAWDRWVEAGEQGAAAIGVCWPGRRLDQDALPTSLRGQIGYFSFAADCSITEFTWDAAKASAAIAQSATTAVLAGERVALGLCRPPGHHASADQFGGYCYLNNAAIAAQQLIDAGQQRVAVFDVDYHHGNGTQDIFYDRDDVLYLSIHGDPDFEFPYFLGRASESGTGVGEGYNHNEPLPAGTTFAEWMVAFDRCVARIVDFAASSLVLSLGVDTFRDDPISHFTLDTDDYEVIGRRLALLDLPTVIIFEGGYAVDEIGENVARLVDGFEAAMNDRLSAE